MSLQYTGGSLLKYNPVVASPQTYTTIGGCKDIKGPNGTVTILDGTTQDVVDNTKRKVGALWDEGQVSTDVWLDLNDTGAAGHRALMTNKGKLGYFQLVPRNQSPAETISFQAVIKGVGMVFPVDGGQMFTLDLDISGPLAIAP